MAAIREFVRGAFGAIGIVALFVAGGFAYAAALNGGTLPAGSAEPALYLPGVETPDPGAAPSVWLVDGYNVLNVGLLADRVREGW